jgi:hypothetical protein
VPVLGELEQLVLLAVLRVGDEAYGVPVLAAIEEATGRTPTLATVHTSRVGEPTPQRGGRRKRYFVVTLAGKRAVRESLAGIRRLARGLAVGWDPS